MPRDRNARRGRGETVLSHGKEEFLTFSSEAFLGKGIEKPRKSDVDQEGRAFKKRGHAEHSSKIKGSSKEKILGKSRSDRETG